MSSADDSVEDEEDEVSGGQQGFRFFLKIGGLKWPMEQKVVGHFLKWFAQAYQTKQLTFG